MIKLHTKIKHNEKVCRAHDLGSCVQGQGCNQDNGQNFVSAITTEANVMKLHRTIEHNKKVCRTHELGSYAQGRGHKYVRGQIVPKIVLLIIYRSKFDETSQKDIAYEKVCRA